MVNALYESPASAWPILSRDAVDTLQRHAPRSGSSCDLYLCYADMPRIRVSGILVTHKSSIDRLVAYCPLSADVPQSGKPLTTALARQMRIALRIAENPLLAADAVDAIGLETMGTEARPVPHWLYGLSCIPLTRDWNGQFLHPRPFCPALFQAMAQQDRAAAWLKQKGSTRKSV